MIDLFMRIVLIGGCLVICAIYALIVIRSYHLFKEDREYAKLSKRHGYED